MSSLRRSNKGFPLAGMRLGHNLPDAARSESMIDRAATLFLRSTRTE
jgi:hypothetical protein